MSLVLIAFLFGVAVHSWIDQPLPPSTLIILSLVFLTSAFLFFGRQLAILFFIFAALFLGLFRYALSFPVSGPTSVASSVGQTVRLEGTIVNDPEESAEHQELILDDLGVNGAPAENKVTAWVQRFPELSYGDRVSFRCELETPGIIDGFNYQRYLLRLHIVATCFSHDEPLLVATNQGNPLRAALFSVRSTIQTALTRALPEPQASISAGLLLGVKSLPEELDQDFRAIGVSHIFAASGSNVAMVLLIMVGGLAYVMKRQKAVWFLLAGVVIYVLLAGAEAAVVRAGIMAATVLIAAHSGRATSPRNLLLLAATVMLLANPRLLRDDIGFQLSMLATTGMAVLGPTLNKKLAFMPKEFGLREALSTTISATAFTLPIMLINFHQFSFLSPIANLLILPLVPYAMATSATAALVSAISPGLSVWVGGAAWGIEKMIVLIATTLATV